MVIENNASNLNETKLVKNQKPEGKCDSFPEGKANINESRFDFRKINREMEVEVCKKLDMNDENNFNKCNKVVTQPRKLYPPNAAKKRVPIQKPEIKPKDKSNFLLKEKGALLNDNKQISKDKSKLKDKQCNKVLSDSKIIKENIALKSDQKNDTKKKKNHRSIHSKKIKKMLNKKGKMTGFKKSEKYNSKLSLNSKVIKSNKIRNNMHLKRGNKPEVPNYMKPTKSSKNSVMNRKNYPKDNTNKLQSKGIKKKNINFKNPKKLKKFGR